MIDEVFKKQMSSNGTFNLPHVENNINDAKLNSFNYLYNIQKEVGKFLRVDFNINDMKNQNKLINTSQTYPKKYFYFINREIVPYHKRKDFKRSNLFNKPLSNSDIASNSKIFDSNYMVFVNGVLNTKFRIVCKEDKTMLVLQVEHNSNNGMTTENEYNQWVTNNVKITVLLVPNRLYASYTTNKYALAMFEEKYGGIPISNFEMNGDYNHDEPMISSLTHENKSDITKTELTNDSVCLDCDITRMSYDDGNIEISLFSLGSETEEITLSAGTKYFEIPLKDMPVPKENIILFTDVNGTRRFDHNVSLKMYYPNIYEIVNGSPSTVYKATVFYSNDDNLSELMYTNDLAIYSEFCGSLLTKYANNSIPGIIKTYNPAEIIYNNKDFDLRPDQDHFKYKVEKLHNIIRNEGEVLRNYLIDQVNHMNRIYLDMTKVNLTSKIRNNNFTEIKNPAQQVTFTEQRYLFVFNNEFNRYRFIMRYFIDGYFYNPDMVFSDTKYMYVYIPVSLIKNNSIMEIEKTNLYNYSKDFKVTNINERPSFNIDVVERNVVYINDIYITKTDGTYLDKSKYDVIIPINGADSILPSDSFKTIEKSFKILLKDPIFVNVNLNLLVKREAHTTSKTIDNNNKYLDLFYGKIDTLKEKRGYRIFRNNRHIPSDLYNIDFSMTVDGNSSISVNMTKNVGDIYHIDLTPNKYKLVHKIPAINNRGIVDLKGIIEKPMDLRWYDVYLNGIKLNPKNLKILSPTRFIIKGIPTLKNLVIYEKDRDNEIFRLDGYSSIIDSLFDTDNDFRTAINNNSPVINDTIGDIITDLLDDLSEDMRKYYDLYLGFIHIQPKLEQILPEAQAFLPDVFKNGCLHILPHQFGVNSTNKLMKIFPRV